MNLTREEYLRKLILEQGYTLKDFAKKIGIPYTTLLSMLNGSIGGSAVDNVIRICKGLGITISELQEVLQKQSDEEAYVLTEREKELIFAYRRHPEMQEAVRRLLLLDVDTDGE